MARRQGDIYARLMVKLLNHPRAWAAGLDGMGLFAFCLMFARANGTDGELPRAAVVTAWGTAAEVGEAILAKLASPTCGLVELRGDLVVVPRYSDHNETADEIARRRGDAARRKADFLERQRNARNGHGTRSTGDPNAFGSVSVSVSDLSEARDQDPEITPPNGSQAATEELPVEAPSEVRRRVVGEDGDSGALFGAWSMGIRAATGVPQTPLTLSERREVVAIANAHGAPATGQQLLDWIQATATAFAKQHDPAFGGFTPSGARKWLNAGRPARAAPRGPLIQGARSTRLWKTGEEV